MLVLIFDTETNGLPDGYNTSIFETDKWPYILQLSYILYDIENNKLIELNDFIINSKGKVTEESFKINGISEKICKRKGVDINTALYYFNNALQKCDLVIAHNLSFDKRVYMVECIRNGIPQYFSKRDINNVKICKKEYCTMKNTISLCKIEKINKNGHKYYKYPKLIELYIKLFNHNDVKNLHDSMADILVCFRCYYYLEYKQDIYKICSKKLKKIFDLYCN